MSKSQIRLSATERYRAAREQYVEASSQLIDALNKFGTLRSEIAQSEQNLKGIEAGWVRDGALDGLRNDRERDAMMDNMRRSAPGYTEIAVEVEGMRRALLCDVDPEIERLKTEQRIARLDIEFSIAELQAVSGESE